MFNSCSSLTSVPLFNTALVTNMSSMFQNCSSLTSTPAFVSSGVTTGNFVTIFSANRALAGSLLSGGKFTISYASAKLSRAAIETIFTNLGIAAAAQTITVTTNPGSPTATSKPSSGTTSGSAVVTLADTSSLVAGMEVTGTGISDTQAVTFTDAGDTVGLTAHGLANDAPVSFSVITTTTGIVIDTIYYVVNQAANTFQVAATVGGSALALTTDGTGTLRRPMVINSISTNVSFTCSANCSATGSVTSTHTALLRWKATLKGWSVTT
jgi:surface protein